MCSRSVVWVLKRRKHFLHFFFQAARILLPGADFPPRGVAFNFEFSTIPGPGLDELDFVTTVGHLMIVVMIF